MSKVKELKEPIVASSAMKRFDFFIQWHLTERCNLHCRHCYQEAKRPKEMTAEEVKRQVDGATEMFKAWEREHGIEVAPSIHFTGGEPFLFEALWEVVEHCRNNGYRTALMTNGSLIRRKDAHEAFSLGVSDIQVSLEGPARLHDAIRGRGSFALASRGVEYLASVGNRVSANVTLSRLNADKIEETVSVAKKLGFCRLGFSRVVPCGSGKSLIESMLTPGELKDAYQRAMALSSPDFEVGSGDPLAGVLSGDSAISTSGLTLSGCSAGFSGVTICSDGSVMPCRRIGLIAGNLKKSSLRTIWASSKLLWQLRRRESYSGKCGECLRWPSCRGCRAVAYAYSAAQGKPDLFADDPQCWLAHSQLHSAETSTVVTF
jgi:radical SAM protein with 4Fe4S-binding SPASM domain